MARMVVVFVFMFVVITIFSFVLPNNLECLTFEISKPRSKPFLVPTWYRPPQSSPGLFETFERIIDKIDAENLELYLMGDLNCNLLSEVVSNNSSHLLNIIDIYGLTQLITRLRVVPHFYSGIVEWAKRERTWKSPHARKGVSPFLAWGDFHARSPFARSPIPEKKWLSNLLQNQLESHNIQVPWSIYA